MNWLNVRSIILSDLIMLFQNNTLRWSNK